MLKLLFRVLVLLVIIMGVVVQQAKASTIVTTIGNDNYVYYPEFGQSATYATVSVNGLGNAIGAGMTLNSPSVTTYQQVFDKTLFPTGGYTFNTLEFIRTTPGATFNAADYSFSFSTTSKAVDGLSATLSDNVGANSQSFWSGNLSGPASNQQIFLTGSTYNYNPANGNLLLQVVKSNASATAGNAFLNVNPYYPTLDTGSMTNEGMPVNNGFGNYKNTVLLIHFAMFGDPTPPASPVPIPAAVWLFGSGLAGLLGLKRKFFR